MSKRNAMISKRPGLITTTPTLNTYKNLSQSELLQKVKLLHEQVLKTNQYLMEVHRLSLYNWDDTDEGNIIVELPDTKRGFLLDSILRLRGVWNATTNTPELLPVDTAKLGWIFRVQAASPVVVHNLDWRTGDYAFYDEVGILHNLTTEQLTSVFTPLVYTESPTISFTDLGQSSAGIRITANLKIDPAPQNDLEVTEIGLFSNAYQKAKNLITVIEEAPTGPNLEGGLRIVFLTERPDVFYDGWLYLIPPADYNYTPNDPDKFLSRVDIINSAARVTYALPYQFTANNIDNIHSYSLVSCEFATLDRFISTLDSLNSRAGTTYSFVTIANIDQLESHAGVSTA